ncbi:uncharacterized protein LOC129566289 [Sitodiplosis mosellana]|uniref:uncharacterized protein LOC129566289 n=1 Tax=Sitodiplosis mosellana TaxID=263140 RepID=UPI0024445C03|nr:uncharacterized protein LOC129566289 [Sitodiplosis mosellana]
MKAITLTVLGLILVLLLLKNVTYAKEHTAEVYLTAPLTQCTLQCNQGYHIVVKKGTLYHNGRKLDENARYPPKMACDLEQSCNFRLTSETYNYMNPAPPTGSQLTIKYDCKEDKFQGNPRRITDYTKFQNCPQDSFVQKHVAYFNDRNIAPNIDTPEAQRERELIAMSVCAQIRRFRQNNPPELQIDPHRGTVFLIYDNKSGRNDFMPSPGENNKCQLKGDALANSFKYNCQRDANKWTCTFEGKGSDVAKHNKNDSHLG